MQATERLVCVVCAIAFGAVACTASTSEDSGGGNTPTTSSDKLKKRTVVDEPFANDPSEKMLPGERSVELDWALAEEAPVIPQTKSSERLRSFYEGAPVPVLLPNDKRALSTVEPTLGDNWYAAMFEYRGREVTIEGDRVIRRAEGLPPVSSQKDDYTISQTHGVLTLSFTRFGAAYTVDIECEKVTKRGTCTDEQFAVELADKLARLGGGR